MSPTTQQLRRAWSPHCEGPWARVSLHGKGEVVVRAAVTDAVLELDRCLAEFGYLTRRADTGGFCCRKIRGGTNWSLHAYGIAVDLNWTDNPFSTKFVSDMNAPMVDAIERIRTNSGAQVWRWGGRFSPKHDPMHFEIIAFPADIASGISGTVRATSIPSPTEDDIRRWNAAILRNQVGAFPDLDRTVRSLSVAALRNALQFVTQIDVTSGRTDEQRVTYSSDLEQAVGNFQRFFAVAADPPGSFGPNSRLVLWQVLEAIRAGQA